MNVSIKKYDYPMMVGAFLIVLGAMLWTVQFYGFSVPFYDEWEAEANWLYRLYEQESLGLSEIFAPHNGHRIVFTRMAALSLYVVNGGWDPQLQLIMSAFLHALICVLLINFGTLKLKDENLALSVSATVLLFAIPFSWLSILVAFQTQFYFMILFAILSLNYFSSAKYILGYLFTTLAIFSMTSGAFILPAFIATTIIEVIRNKSITKEQIVHILISATIFTIFILTLPEETSDQDYYAQHLLGFIVTILAAISWPFRVSWGIGMIIYAPLVVFIIRAVFIARVPVFLLSLGMFISLQILAMGYFRGGEGVPPANRYWEIMIVGIWLNYMCVTYLAHYSSIKFVKKAAIVWLFVAITGMASLGYQAFANGLPTRKAESLVAQSLITEFLETGRTEQFDGRTTFEVSHLDTNVLLNILNDKTVKNLLPSTLGIANPDRLRAAKLILLSSSPFLLIIGIVLLGFSFRREWIVQKVTNV
ncbi:MAG: hypothetical protein O2971_19100 [Proteobacteria bacterium]|nr:hypothetical protein [Pseudomonadota bacterium]